MKLRFVTIFVLSFILLAPLAASAADCCFQAGQVVSGNGGAIVAPDSCILRANGGNCDPGYAVVDCSTKAICQAKLPICCVYSYPDASMKNWCFESSDHNYDCSTIQPTGSTATVKNSYCADLPDCSGDKGHMFLSPPATPTAATPAAEYPVIVPKLSIPIPTLSLQDFAHVVQEDGYIYIPFISVYLVAAYKLGVGVAAVLAIIMIMIGGFIWITAGGDSGKTGRAKSMISGAVVGLVLTVGSYVALDLINPNLVNFKALKIQVVTPQTIDVVDDYAPEVDNSNLTTGTNTSTPSQYDGIFAKYAPCAGVAPEVLKAIAQAESGLNAGAVNKSGYTGLFQTKAANCPATVKSYCANLTDPDNNTAAGAAMIAKSVSTIKANCPTASPHDMMVMIYVGHNMGGGMLKYVTQNTCSAPAMRKAAIDYYVNNPSTARKYATQYQQGCLAGATDDQSMANCTGGPKFDYAERIASKADGSIGQVLYNGSASCPY